MPPRQQEHDDTAEAQGTRHAGAAVVARSSSVASEAPCGTQRRKDVAPQPIILTASSHSRAVAVAGSARGSGSGSGSGNGSGSGHGSGSGSASGGGRQRVHIPDIFQPLTDSSSSSDDSEPVVSAARDRVVVVDMSSSSSSDDSHGSDNSHAGRQTTSARAGAASAPVALAPRPRIDSRSSLSSSDTEDSDDSDDSSVMDSDDDVVLRGLNPKTNRPRRRTRTAQVAKPAIAIADSSSGSESSGPAPALASARRRGASGLKTVRVPRATASRQTAAASTRSSAAPSSGPRSPAGRDFGDEALNEPPATPGGEQHQSQSSSPLLLSSERPPATKRARPRFDDGLTDFIVDDSPRDDSNKRRRRQSRTQRRDVHGSASHDFHSDSVGGASQDESGGDTRQATAPRHRLLQGPDRGDTHSNSNHDADENRPSILLGQDLRKAIATHIESEYHVLRAGAPVSQAMSLLLPRATTLCMVPASQVSQRVRDAAASGSSVSLLGGVRMDWHHDWTGEPLELLFGRLGRYVLDTGVAVYNGVDK